MSRLPSKSNQDGRFSPGRHGSARPLTGSWHSAIVTSLANSWLRRTWHSLPEAAVSLVALGVFGSLFIHVFRDIFSPDIAALAPATVRGATAITCTLIAVAGFLVARRGARDDPTIGWARFSRLSGAQEEHVVITEKFVGTTVAAITGILTGVVVYAATGAVPAVVGSVILCLLAAWVPPATDQAVKERPQRFALVRTVPSRFRVAVLVRWRAGLLFRAPVTWLFWSASAVVCCGIFFAALAGIPAPFVAILAWLAGWIAALPQAMQAASESASFHFERSLGITPVQMARSHAGTGAMVAAVCGLVATLTCLACGRMDALLPAAASAATAPSLMPALLWQIDARRPLVQWMTSLMASLFLATAMIATKAAFLLWPVVLVFLAQQQGKRLQAELPSGTV